MILNLYVGVHMCTLPIFIFTDNFSLLLIFHFLYLDSVDHEIDKIVLKLQRNQSALLKDMSFLSLSSSNFLRSYFVRAKESSIDLLTSDSKETSIALTVQQNGFDATTTPWYVDAVTGPKDIFIVVDLSMNSQSQAEIRRTAVNSVLDTISPNDVVTVYVLHNSYFGPLDKICSKKGTPLRGTRDVVLSLKQQLVKKSLSLLNTNTNTSTTYSQKRWQQIFRVMFNTVDEVRSANTNQEGSNGNGGRGGGEGRSAALILFTTKGGGPRAAGLMFKLSPKDGRPVLANQEDTTWHEENADHNFREIQDDTKWHEADEVRNVHEIPIFTFQFAEIIESSHDDHEKLHYRCDSLGILSNNSITTLSHARDVKHMYLHLIALPTKFDKISSTVHFWGGLIHSMNQTIRDYADIQTGKSNTLNVMTFTRAVYVNNKLLGVIGLDHTLSNLKNSLDSISNKMGQDSFPILATASGDTIYHQLNERYSHSTLFNVGKDIGDLEYFPSFSEQVRIPFLNGLIGSKILIVMRALAAGDATTEGFEGRLIETYYYYTPVPKWNLRILLAYDQFDLQKTSLKPSSDVKLDRLITSQIEDYQSVDNQYLLVLNTATEKNGAVFYNDHNCASSNSGLAFSNCKPDEYCRRVLLGISHPKGTVAGAPQCVDDSDCRCEPHRWPIGLTSRDSSVVGIAPRSLDKSSQAFELLEKFKLMTSASIEEKRKLTRKMTLFLNSDPSSASLTEQRVSVDALNQVPFAAKIGQTWREEHTRTGKHNNTVWVYYGSHTGISSIYPANNWGFTWDPTRRPWYMRAITQGSKNITSVISTPYIDGGGVGLISTLASPVWGSSMDPSTSHVLGVVGYDFIYSTMHQFVSSLTDGICSTKNIRDMNNGNGNNNEKDVACFLFDFSGLLLTHSDFLATEEEKKAALSFGVTIDHVDEGDWPIQNVFIGKKEPDLGNALIKSGVIVPQSSTSPDSMRMVSFYKVNMDIFTVEKQVIQGEITLNDNPSCLQTTENSPIKWFVKPIKHSNALLLVVPGYRRRSDKECTTTVAADPPTTMPHHLKPRCSHDVATTSLFDAKDDAAIRYSGRGKSWQRSANTNTCPRCQPGFYNGDVGGKCRACLHGSFSDRFGAGSCSLCVAGKYSMTPGIPKCNVCQQGMYSLEIGASNYPCKPFEHCPNGADCRQSDGLRIKNLVPLNGHWRANSTSSSFVDCSLAYYGLQRQTYASKRCCPYFSGMNETTTETTNKGNIRLPTICNETLQWNHSSDSQCHTGYIGKLCASCAEDYVFHFDGCKLCPGGSSIGWALVSIFVGGLFSFGVVVCILQPCCVKRIILYDEDSDDATIIGQVKIIVTFCQLSAFSTAVFNGVPWPSEFLTMTSTLSLVNFDFADFISTWLCSVSVAPLDRFLMLMITPAFMAAGIYGSYYIHLFSCNDYINVCKRKESLHHLEEQRTRKKILNKVHDWERRAMMMKVLVLCALWMYPVLASSLFSVFRCRIIEGVEGGPWLHMDLSIACYQEKHMPYVIAAVFGMIFYVSNFFYGVIGFFLIYFFIKLILFFFFSSS